MRGQWRQLATILEVLRCPRTGQHLLFEQDMLTTPDRRHTYRLSSSGIPLFGEQFCSTDAAKQQSHYDQLAPTYIANLNYPHTIEYAACLDRALFRLIEGVSLKLVGEICCGRGLALQLIGDRIGCGIGVDISQNMLEAGIKDHTAHPNIIFVQGDATALPLSDNVFDAIFICGGVHHVNDRRALFSEVFRVLKPGGHFFFREPCNDFALWRAIRKLVYRLSPALDHATERPLQFEETVPVLQDVGFGAVIYDRHGFLGFCLLMNSDVLVFNRAFRFLPGIRTLVKLAAGFDEWFVHLPHMNRAGLQVVGCSTKPS
ncbi:MAG: class I SAM-dependent methyltransferase [Alphaproteobacteria bacterium]|nr:class I SAM-dependent methyltransferase [Alphaproteobacteria bacterium]